MNTASHNNRIMMLGTGNAVTTECYNTCFVIETPKGLLLVDAGGGNGILSQMDRAQISFGGIHDMFITHAHTDHILGAVWVARMILTLMNKGQYEGTFTVYSHHKVLETLEFICNKTLPKKLVANIGDRFILHELNDKESFTAAGMEMQCFDILSTKEPQFGFRAILPGGTTLVCLGDEPYNEGNRGYVENADWLMCEAFCLYSDRDIFKPYEKHHSTALEAGKLAADLNVKNLILYHTEDKTLSTRKESYAAEAQLNFQGAIYVPDDIEVIEII